MVKRRIISDPTAFAELSDFVQPYEATGRTDSAAFLIWFLQAIYRLDEIDAQDSVCDRRADMGVDALVINDDAEEVVLFQAKRKQKIPATLGDSDLKAFIGALTQFKNKAAIEKVIATTENTELKSLLVTHKVADKVEQGYVVRLIFIANVAADANATRYVLLTQDAGTPLTLWDLNRIAPVLKQFKREWFVTKPTKLKINSEKSFVDGPRSKPRLIFAAVPAGQLVMLPGLDDTRLFAENVRLGLGRTRVNKEILASVMSNEEHPKFLTFHNGLTMVAQELSIRGGTIHLNKYSVCNGCQSLLTFYDNRKLLTPEMEVLVRIVRVGDQRETAESIAYRTNNQNAISLRDLSANDNTQIQIKAEFDQLFGDRVTYVIKRGEGTGKMRFKTSTQGNFCWRYTRVSRGVPTKSTRYLEILSRRFSHMGLTHQIFDLPG